MAKAAQGWLSENESVIFNDTVSVREIVDSNKTDLICMTKIPQQL